MENEMGKNKPNISIILPTYRCSAYLCDLHKRLVAVLETITTNFEIIFVNDCSPEDDWKKIIDLAQKDRRVKGINLARNFGQHPAIFAGLEFSQGEWVVVMDADLQDLPEEIINLYNKTKEGYKIVFASRAIRQDSLFKRVGSKLFYLVLSYLTESKQDGTIANFGIYHRNVIDNVIKMEESTKWFPLFVKWVGFEWTALSVKHGKRANDKGSYTFKMLFNLAFNVMISFSDKPLRLIIKFGMTISLFSFVYAIFIIAQKLLDSRIVLGWSSLIASIWFLSGLIISILGIIGLYISKIFNEIKKRPIFIIKEII